MKHAKETPEGKYYLGWIHEEMRKKIRRKKLRNGVYVWMPVLSEKEIRDDEEAEIDKS